VRSVCQFHIWHIVVVIVQVSHPICRVCVIEFNLTNLINQFRQFDRVHWVSLNYVSIIAENPPCGRVLCQLSMWRRKWRTIHFYGSLLEIKHYTIQKLGDRSKSNSCNNNTKDCARNEVKHYLFIWRVGTGIPPSVGT